MNCQLELIVTPSLSIMSCDTESFRDIALVFKMDDSSFFAQSSNSIASVISSLETNFSKIF